MKSSSFPIVSRRWLALLVATVGPWVAVRAALPAGLVPDLVVASDGSGNFRTVQAAIDSIPADNTERRVIFIRNGSYDEHVRIEKSFITLLGEDRHATRITSTPNAAPAQPSTKGPVNARANTSILLTNASDIVIDNLTLDNPTRLFVVFSSGTGTRIVIQNAEILGAGGDTLSLWTRGMYYHRNIHVTGTYHFVGPRGTCYISDSVFEVLGSITNALFNEGMEDEKQKFVLERCRIISKVPFGLGSHFRDAAWYFIDCEFPDTLRREGHIWIAQPNPQQPKPISEMFKWATDRVYYAGSKGPDYPWLKDNLEKSPAKSKEEITAAWTFSGEWDPENSAAPVVTRVARDTGTVTVTFAEPVSVKGRPRLLLADGKAAEYLSGSGTATLTFRAPSNAAAAKLELNGGAIVASHASAHLRLVTDGLALRNQ